MDRNEGIGTILQLHLGSDSAAVFNLPFVLSILNENLFSSPKHLNKWSARINSLLHSKTSGAVWAGACIALKSARLCRSLLLDAASGWITTVVPVISRKEPVSVHKAAIKLVTFIFTDAVDSADFQRQVVAPNISSFTSTLVTVVEKTGDLDLILLALDAISLLISVHPNLLHSSQSLLASLTLAFLGRATPTSMPNRLLDSLARLHSSLPATGGKVGATNLWRKNVDETMASCWSAYASLRTSFVLNGSQAAPPGHGVDPAIAVPHNLDRLRCGIRILSFSLRASISRPVVVSMAAFVNLCITLLGCHTNEDTATVVDWTVHGLEVAVVPDIQALGCELTDALAKSLQHRLSPHLSRLLAPIAWQIELQMPISQRLLFVEVLSTLYRCCHPSHGYTTAGRLIKALLPCFAIMIPQESGIRRDPQQSEDSVLRSGRKGKRRMREDENTADVELLEPKNFPPVLRQIPLIIATLEVIPHLLRTPNLPQHLLSISSRIFVSLFVDLQQISAGALVIDQGSRDDALQKISDICIDLLPDTSSAMSNVLPLVTRATTQNSLASPHLQHGSMHNHRTLELLIHPRLPPFVQLNPQLDALLLVREQQSTLEKEVLDNLGLDRTNTLRIANGLAQLTASPESYPQQSPAQGSQNLMRSQDTEMREGSAYPLYPLAQSSTAPSAITVVGTEVATVSASDPSQRQSQATAPTISAVPLSPGGGFPAKTGTSAKKSPTPIKPLPSSIPGPSTNVSATDKGHANDDDDDEEIPSIDMASDSDPEC